MAPSDPPEAVVVSGPITPFGGLDHSAGHWGVGVTVAWRFRDRQKASDKGLGGPYDSSYRAYLTGLFNGQCRSRSESM